MPDYGRDLNIGTPEIIELKAVISKLNEVKTKVEDVAESNQEVIAELKKIKVGTSLAISVDLDEGVE